MHEAEAPAAVFGEWLPIETAPQEGQFLVFMPTDVRQPMQVARWHPNVKVIGGVFAFDAEPPTHWMPLPKTPTKKIMMTPIYTVADIRKALEGRADDELVHTQVVASDGTAWTMACVIAPVFQSPRGLVIDMRHPELKTLTR